jgi:hypothetical protein
MTSFSLAESYKRFGNNLLPLSSTLKMEVLTAPFKSILHLWQEDAVLLLILVSVLAELARW